MIPFSVQVTGFKNIQKVLKTVIKTLPFPKPTLFSGPGSSLQLCEAIAQMNIQKILIVTDKMLVKIGLINDVTDKLSQLGVAFEIYDGVEPDPNYDQVDKGTKKLKETGCEAVLAVGGGSSIDAAKIICAKATNNKPISKMAGMFRIFKPILPLYTIPTTAGTGSEVTIAAVVSDPETHEKKAIMDPKIVPLMAALDANLMTGLPPHITAATGMDALTHAVEAYISANAIPETDAYALAATRLIMENLPKVMTDGSNLDARHNMALASYYAGLAFTKAGVGYVHAIAHNFGALYHTPHGLANSIVLPHVLDFSQNEVTERLAKLAEVSGLKNPEDNNVQLAQKFIDHVRTMSRDFNIPEKLEDLKEEDIPAISQNALKEAHFTYAVPKYMNQKTCESLIKKMVA